MKIHLQKELDRLKKRLFHLSSLVEEILEESIRAVHEGNVELAASVRGKDQEIDRLEVEVEEECLKVLALHQPVATDLRFLIAVLKMNNDLERIGDLAVNIAAGKSCLAGDSRYPVYGEKLADLGQKARAMLRKALESLMYVDAEGARGVLSSDDEVDDLYHEFVQRVKADLSVDGAGVDELLCWMMVAKHVERVADLATNIAEDTIYTVEGEIIRHGRG